MLFRSPEGGLSEVIGGGRDARRFITLTVAYSPGLVTAAVGFYFYVVFPLWIWFAPMSLKSASARRPRTAARLLTVSLILWISFTVPLFFFFTFFGWLAYTAEVSAILLGTIVVHRAADSLVVGDPRSARAQRVGLAAGVATSANLVILAASGLLGIGTRIVAGGLPVVNILFLTGSRPQSLRRCPLAQSRTGFARPS